MPTKPTQTEKIQLKHPTDKKMPAIDKSKYDLMRKTILNVLSGKELTHTELFTAVNDKLKGKFEGNISWYGEGVKLDLEAEKLIERTGTKPQKYRIINK